MDKILILDVNSLIYRFYYALPSFYSHKNIPTNALFGLTNALLKIIKEEKPQYLIACFDSKTPTFRHNKYLEYKSQRPKIENELKIQINLAPKILKSFGFLILEKDNYEADDLIGLIVKKNPDKYKIIYSGDLDLLQLVNDRTILKFFKKGISQVEIYDEQKIKEKYQLKPYQLIDYKALQGDPSDNIIGIKGIGPKTAINLLSKYQTIENIIDLSEKKIIPQPLRDLILINKDRLLLNKEIITLATDLNLNFNLEEAKLTQLNIEKIIETLKEFDFYSIIERLKKEDSKNLFQLSTINFLTSPSFLLDNIFCLLDDNFIYLYDGQNFFKLAQNLTNIEKILTANRIIIYDLKFFLQKYYQLSKNLKRIIEINLNNFFDIRIAFWLIKNIIKPDLNKIFSFYYPNLDYDNLLEKFISFMPQIYQDLEKQLTDYSLNHILSLDQNVTLILLVMEINGLKIDKNKIKTYQQQLQEELKNLKEEIYQLVGYVFNLNSNNEIRRVIFDQLKIKSKDIRKTSKGELSVSEEQLIKIKDKHPVIEKILSYRKKSKLLSQFIKNLNKYLKDSKIQTNFDITGTTTGRLTSFYPNLQNLPKEIKQFFIPSQGCRFVSYDYSQIELRLLAHFSQDENLINIFKEDLDIHSLTAKLLFKEENEQTRRLAKLINYGIVYGISPQSLAQKTNLSLMTAKKLIEDYYLKFPGIKKLNKDLEEKFNAYTYTETLLGRKRFYFNRNLSDYLKIAINSPIQGSAADILKLAMIDIFNYLKNNNLLNEVKLVLSIHDELVFEIKENILLQVKFKIKNIMENVINLSVPLKVNIKEGYNLQDIK
jgi:DNA polymerase-1